MGNFVIFLLDLADKLNATDILYLVQLGPVYIQFLSIFVAINLKNYKNDFIHDSDFIFLVDLRQVCNKYTTNKEYFRK